MASGTPSPGGHRLPHAGDADVAPGGRLRGPGLRPAAWGSAAAAGVLRVPEAPGAKTPGADGEGRGGGGGLCGFHRVSWDFMGVGGGGGGR